MATSVSALADARAFADAPVAPDKWLFAREMRSYLYVRTMAAFGRPIPVEVKGEGQPVLVLPGFMASDKVTARLRRSLNAAGFDAHGWNLGRNRGVTAGLLGQIDARVDAMGRDRPVTLIGWSLGGLVAREYAKHAPGKVARVITLGSPFSGDLRANNAWRAYEYIAGHPVDRPPIAVRLHEKPTAPTIACWSRRDGIVAPACARGRDGERDLALEFDCTHMAFVADPRAIRTIARLIQGDGRA